MWRQPDGSSQGQYCQQDTPTARSRLANGRPIRANCHQARSNEGQRPGKVDQVGDKGDEAPGRSGRRARSAPPGYPPTPASGMRGTGRQVRFSRGFSGAVCAGARDGPEKQRGEEHQPAQGIEERSGKAAPAGLALIRRILSINSERVLAGQADFRWSRRTGPVVLQ